MASAQDYLSCAVCRRHFLPGESVRLYRTSASSELQRVCPLCREAADKRGWELVEATRDSPLRVPSDPVRFEAAVERDRVVERLTGELDQAQREIATLQQRLAASEQSAGSLARSHDELAALPDELRRRDEALRVAEAAQDALRADVVRLGAELDQARLAAQRLERAERRVREVEESLETQRAEVARVTRAREREADPAYLSAVAAEAFNRSRLAEGVVQASRTRGAPSVNLAPSELVLPRRVTITIWWERDWRRYAALIDVLERTARVEELDSGSSLSDLPPSALRPNARWTPELGLASL